MDEPKDPLASINEPGRPIAGTADKSADKPADKPAADEDNGNDLGKLPAKAELEDMTRAELDALADVREVDTTGCHTKADVIEVLQKDARRRRR